MKTVRVSNIEWDVDLEENEIYSDAVKELGLPESIVITVDEEDLEDDEFLADELSNEFGFCVCSLQYEVI